MRCPHCNTDNPELLPFTRSVDGGRAYAQTCTRCGHILGIRRAEDGDPPVDPHELNSTEVERLRFLRWRLDRRLPDPADTPPTAA
jgi:hypothetical protein